MRAQHSRSSKSATAQDRLHETSEKREDPSLAQAAHEASISASCRATCRRASGCIVRKSMMSAQPCWTPMYRGWTPTYRDGLPLRVSCTYPSPWNTIEGAGRSEPSEKGRAASSPGARAPTPSLSSVPGGNPSLASLPVDAPSPGNRLGTRVTGVNAASHQSRRGGELPSVEPPGASAGSR
jgi:hypothetical protein